MSVNPNVMTWETEQRRVGTYAALGVAAVLAIVGVALWWFVPAAGAWVYWTFVGLLVLVLAFQAALLFLNPRAAAEAEAAPQAEAEAIAPLEAPAAPQTLTLRCGDCATVFDVTDTGARPLLHTCPGCGAEGALHAPEAAEPSPYAPPADALPPSAYAAPAVEAPAPVAVKKLKLRCGGCKEVFVIEDSGERPLKRPCPHCGRTGVIH